MNQTRAIVIPLLVMLLLTFLVGLSAFWTTRSLERSVSSVTDNVSKTLILNNIRWNLRQVQQDQRTNPKRAQSAWDDARRQAVLLTRVHVASEMPLSLKTILEQNHPPANLDVLLAHDFLTVNLGNVPGEMEALQQNAQFITTTVTLSMLILGLLLTLITAYDLNQLFRDLVRSRDLNVTVQEEERRRIAQDLHDGVVQDLIDLKRSYSPEKVDSLIETLRRVCHNLKPQVLEDLGLASALEFLADDLRKSGVQNVQLNLEEEGLARLPKSYELPLFRVVQELFSNIKNHAGATQAALTVVYHPEESPMLRGYVKDNGRGFNVKTVSHKGMGLTGVRERIQQLGGQLTIESAADRGSQFQFVIPVKPDGPR